MTGIRKSNSHFAFILLLVVYTFLACLPRDAGAVDDFFKELEANNQWTGDFDGMAERRLVRVLVVFNKMLFFLDQGRQRGVNVDMFREFEKHINAKQKKKTLKIKILFIPVPRDQLLPALLDGRGDIAAANLTITPGRQKLVDFSDPWYSNAKEILITGPSAPPIKTLADLAGKEIHLRPTSSYHEHLVKLNERYKKEGKPPIKIVPASPLMEDSDLIEMVNAELLPMVIVDDHKAHFWGQIFDKITLHTDIYVNEGGKIAWALRKNSPKLAAELNAFVKKSKKGSLLGNMLFKRYLKENKWARNSTSPEEIKKFHDVVKLFMKYADQYQFDFLMTAALAYQESGLDHSKKSHVGAVGIMQVLPTTAADKNVGIPDIEKIEKNIHAGHKYLRFLHDRYFSDPAIDGLNKYLFSFAGYNAGPAKVAQLRKEAKKNGLDPNVWFHNVELIAARRIGRETVQYVGNIYKYYLAYRLSMDKIQAKETAKSDAGS